MCISNVCGWNSNVFRSKWYLYILYTLPNTALLSGHKTLLSLINLQSDVPMDSQGSHAKESEGTIKRLYYYIRMAIYTKFNFLLLLSNNNNNSSNSTEDIRLK